MVTYQGSWHSITDTSLAPLPVQRPIPLWFGIGRTIDPIPPDPVRRRLGRLADGWMPLFKPDAVARTAIEKVHEAARAAGRDPRLLTMEMTLPAEAKTRERLTEEAKRLHDFGATHLNIEFAATSAHGQIEDLKRFREIMDVF